MTRRKILQLVAALVLAIIVGLVAGYWLAHPAPVVETYAPPVIQADGSTIVERKPDAKAKPKQILPKRTKLERVVQIEAQGQGIKLASGEVKTCPRVTIDLSLVRTDDGSKRVIASSPDGEITGAIDIPVETAAPPPAPKPWAAGISVNPVTQTGGIWIERDIGRVRLGVEINQARPSMIAPLATEIRVRAGWTF